MSAFKDMMANDNHTVFLNVDEFADPHTIEYDGETYTDVPAMLTDLDQSARNQTATDHMQGVFLATSVLHCDIRDIGGVRPEFGTKIFVSDTDSGFMRPYYVGRSYCEMLMCHIELQAIDE